ncbi:MAG: hypothetical protein AAB066_05645 [Candidatus Margulisiibacteriota bacterium]
MPFEYFKDSSGKTFESGDVAKGTGDVGKEIDITLAGATSGLVAKLAEPADEAIAKMLKGPSATATAFTDTTTNKSQEGNLEFYSKTGLEVSTATAVLEVGKSAATLVINAVKEGGKRMSS